MFIPIPPITQRLSLRFSGPGRGGSLAAAAAGGAANFQGEGGGAAESSAAPGTREVGEVVWNQP